MRKTSNEAARRWTYETVSEKDFQASIVEVAQLYGWLVWHDVDSRKNAPGMLDLILAHPLGDFLMWECKTEKGRVRTEQKQWIAALVASGLEASIVRPSDMDAIIARLQKGKLS